MFSVNVDFDVYGDFDVNVHVHVYVHVYVYVYIHIYVYVDVDVHVQWVSCVIFYCFRGKVATCFRDFHRVLFFSEGN